MYKVRVILDTKEDVIRTFLINENVSLEKLHFAIINSFGFNGQEMASFYRADSEWNQGEEIPLFNMAEAGEGVSMATETLSNALLKEGDKLIYVYDFLAMWTFYVEVIEISEAFIEGAKTVLSVGKVPVKVPEKEFKADELEKDFEDELGGFDTFESLDDFDFENY
ncbi:IS1096 element passenger TnpR family protein [Tenacibaculum maritimum]|uniref:IS1096 element passenger TnpR family protein n=1 Tax=Tenacibaculum maritimum TaxID=107401 RepID=UPI0038908343